MQDDGGNVLSASIICWPLETQQRMMVSGHNVINHLGNYIMYPKLGIVIFWSHRAWLRQNSVLLYNAAQGCL